MHPSEVEGITSALLEMLKPYGIGFLVIGSIVGAVKYFGKRKIKNDYDKE